MKKKIILGGVALFVALGSVAGFSAFEAHVINVTAKIENALSVPTEAIDFGTVFPQEELEEPLAITLSQSFLDEDRVDDVEYIIRQKPKCAVTEQNGTVLVGPTATGHVNVDSDGNVTIDCGPEPAGFDSNTQEWGVLPDLCPYISKHPDNTPDNDSFLNSFHIPWKVVQDDDGTWGVRWLDTRGRLAKSDQDLVDDWTIDLAVPCFGDHCAQDWEEFVLRVNPDVLNPDVLNPDVFVQDIANEHKVFGCDLWVEVFGISLPPGLGCSEKVDVMLVLDRSGSISSTDPDGAGPLLSELQTLKNAGKAFVDAMSPLSTATSAQMGLVSFSSSATLDEHLTDDETALKSDIDALVSGGLTNLEDAILDATTELENPGDGHDRADGDSPDFMVIITDGAPTASNTGGDHSANAKAAADAAKAAGIEIYVVGVGTSTTTMEFLRDNIASSAGHYFDAANFDDLETILEGLIECNNNG